MQKNKLVHEDIKAVCNSAAKKLVAMGLVAATTVVGANSAGVSYKNIACAQTPENNANDKSEEKKSSGYTAAQFKNDMDEFFSSLKAYEAEFNKKFEELKSKTDKNIATILARYEHKPEDGKWKFTQLNFLKIDDESVQRLCNLSNEIKEAAGQAYALRHKLDYLRERIRDYDKRLESGFLSADVERFLQPQSQEPDRYDIKQAPAYVAWATNEVNRLEPLARDMLCQLCVDDQEQTDFEDRMRWLDPSYEVLRVMAEEDSLDKFFDTSSRFDTVIPAIEQQLEERRRNCEEVDRYHSELKELRDANKQRLARLMTTNAEKDLVCEMREREDWHPADQTTDNSEYEPTYMEDDPYAEEEAQETQPERASETFQLNINQPFVQLSTNVSRTMQQGDPNAWINTFSSKN